ncbi:hypothetical protein SLEP1_g24654 [Rubroshorea leprosula]|uniref:Uncharacterized protein n=1 Tax=Rubroshorea leprosula TaxID=152421 RepID=A0AAV5JQS5_9ROSI|nr:hypothetical protein SLEP1_g24654 [Rubroshorea leprosula]
MIAGAECKRASNVGSAQQAARAGSVQQQGRRGMMARDLGAEERIWRTECRRSGCAECRRAEAQAGCGPRHRVQDQARRSQGCGIGRRGRLGVGARLVQG